MEGFDMAQVQQAGTPILLSASGAVSLAPGSLIGFFVNSTSGGTIVLRDGGASGTAVSGTITPSAGWNTFPAYFATACYATIAGTINVTFVFSA